jgi:hypothetical protein
MKQIALALCALALIAAAPAGPRTVGIGELVFKNELKEPLPNAFGRPDIFGRKRTIGVVEVRYIGLVDGRPTLRRIDTTVLNTETTMSRGPAVATAQTNGNTTTVMASRPGGVVAPAGASALDIALDPAEPELLVEGSTIRVIEATGTRLTFEVRP